MIKDNISWLAWVKMKSTIITFHCNFGKNKIILAYIKYYFIPLWRN